MKALKEGKATAMKIVVRVADVVELVRKFEASPSLAVTLAHAVPATCVGVVLSGPVPSPRVSFLSPREPALELLEYADEMAPNRRSPM